MGREHMGWLSMDEDNVKYVLKKYNVRGGLIWLGMRTRWGDSCVYVMHICVS
jgi:hypothetical protein